MDIFTRMESVLLKIDAESNGIEPIAATYPSSDWNTLSWSYRLVLDLKRLRQRRARRGLGVSGFFEKLFGLFGRHPARDRFSYHGDSSRKIYLLKVLRERKKNSCLVVPEVGPMGFDIVPALSAGYEKVIAFDVNQKYVDLCREVWSEWDGLKFEVADTNTFFSQLDFFGKDVLIPDWSHLSGVEELRKRNGINLIEYAPPRDFFGHLKRIDQTDIDRFFEGIETLEKAMG
jgi:hypothetical protein